MSINNDSRQLSIFQPQFDFSGNIRKAELDGRSYVSIYDVLEKYSTDSNPRRAYANAIKLLEAQDSEVVRKGYNLRMYKFPGAGQRETPIGTVEFFLRLISVIEIPEWEHIRVWMNSVIIERIEDGKPKITPPKTRKEEKYLARQIVYEGKDRADALAVLQVRREVIDTFKNMMSAVAKVCDDPRYGEIANAEYVSLFGYTAKDLKRLLNTNSVRDALTETELKGLQFLEVAMEQKLLQAKAMTNDQVVSALHRIAVNIRRVLDEVSIRFQEIETSPQPRLNSRN